MSERRYSAEQVIEALKKARGIMAAAARALGCERQTVALYCQRYPTVEAARKEARETLLDLAEGKLFQQMDAGSEWAIKLLLTTLGKERGYVPRSEMTGGGGREIVFRVVYGDPAVPVPGGETGAATPADD